VGLSIADFDIADFDIADFDIADFDICQTSTHTDFEACEHIFTMQKVAVG
jgi:hypothetical protein